MVEIKRETTIGIIFPWIAVAIGGINGWIEAGTIEGIAVGVLLGILVSLCIYLGLIPVLGVFLCHLAIHFLFDAVGLNLIFLYWFGIIVAAIYTLIVVILIIAQILDD